jgi:maltooligosyltrehalose trehalohydrolase
MRRDRSDTWIGDQLVPPIKRRLSVGAEVQPDGGVHFRVWAPRCECVEVLIESQPAALVRVLERETDGYFAGLISDAAPGSHYRYRLDGANAFPDPASRSQPEGPRGPSAVVDPDAFHWTDQGWPGLTAGGQVIYEMHVGTFTRSGTWTAAVEQLGELAALGVTVLEMMPVADFCGRFGWGYDGVNLFAPTRLYGAPHDLRAFIDRAHAAGLGVILDVISNHLGPEGDYLKQFSPDYFTDRYDNEWGEAINFDGPTSRPVRDYFLSNAAYWIDEFHFDGLRLDATQQIFDASSVHIIREIVDRARQAARGRKILLIGENEPQQTNLVRSTAHAGYGMDALWNDDFHRSAMVALTGHNEAYYTDYLGSPQELVSAVKYGFLYQGQRYRWQGKRRGTPAFDLPPSAFVHFLQNHDQIANTAFGLRVHELTSPGRYRALTALVLLTPSTPMLFQGQEFAASSPFLYFADHRSKIAASVRKGRADFLSQFPSLAAASVQSRLADPGDASTFECCKLDFSEREGHATAYALHCDLLKLRRDNPLFQSQQRGSMDGAVLAPEALALRFFGEDGDDCLLLVNLGRDLHLYPSPEPLLAPPEHRHWQTLWSSEHPRYGGAGDSPIETDDGWRIPGHAAAVLVPALG